MHSSTADDDKALKIKMEQENQRLQEAIHSLRTDIKQLHVEVRVSPLFLLHFVPKMEKKAPNLNIALRQSDDKLWSGGTEFGARNVASES